MNNKVQSHHYGEGLGDPRTEWRKYPYKWEDEINEDCLHRLDGPAIVFDDNDGEGDDGAVAWYIHGEEYFEFRTYCIHVKPLISDEDYLILILTYGNNK